MYSTFCPLISILTRLPEEILGPSCLAIAAALATVPIIQPQTHQSWLKQGRVKITAQGTVWSHCPGDWAGPATPAVDWSAVCDICKYIFLPIITFSTIMYYYIITSITHYYKAITNMDVWINTKGRSWIFSKSRGKLCKMPHWQSSLLCHYYIIIA